MSPPLNKPPNKPPSSSFTDLKQQWSRNITLLLPGVDIKRWLFIGTVGFVVFALGLALFLDVKPVTLSIEFLKFLAPYIPSSISGPGLMLLGILCLWIGAKKAYKTVISAVADDGRDPDLFEALYRKFKLSHGPRVVAIGGGTGLSTLLRGIKHYTTNITAVVTVGDDGGSSGRLREEHGIIPPGDIRNCIAALADEEQLITALFQYRFKTGTGLEGHSFGNLFLAAMCRITGDMFSAIKESSKVLNIRGRVLPSTLDNIQLVAELTNGQVVHGESQIPEAIKAAGSLQENTGPVRIKALHCEPQCPLALPEVIEALDKADLIILGPGSLYTSVVPNILIYNIAQAIAQSTVPKVYVCNMMTQPGETDGYTVADHVEAILNHSPFKNLIDCVFVNSWLPEKLLKQYEQAGYKPVELDGERCKALNVEIAERLLIDETDPKTVRHNPKRLARAIMHWYKQEARRRVKLGDVFNRVWPQSSPQIDESRVKTHAALGGGQQNVLNQA